MRSHLLVTLTALSPLVFAACQTSIDTTEQSLIARCTTTVGTATSEIVVGPGGGGGSGGTGGGSGLPTSPDSCPVCRDANGNSLPASACTVHDDVCVGVSGNPGASAVRVTQTLTVLQAATATPAVAYYGACDGNGKTCEQRDFAYQLFGNELAVATFGSGVTTVYAIPTGAGAVKASQPIFPLLPSSAGFHNPAVHVVFRNQAGATVDAYGDLQNDCRVVADNGTQPAGNVPCWCTQC
jgi:hypothetical protein